jgi:hypothetical protein
MMVEPQPAVRSSRHALPQRPVEPPITKHTLSELDVSKILSNSKLRHDINFDPDLHFRPNTEGEKGKKKQERSACFWKSLEHQLTEFVVDRTRFYAQHGSGDDWCLPVLLKTIKEILQTLVPQRDREFLDEGLSLELLMQQFHRGILDLDKLALWLSRVLKSHCAPMRDNEVDKMYNLVSSGNRNGDIHQLVEGLQQLLSVLEFMKLDVANHQIRCLRAMLIEDTVGFERKYFEKKIRSRKVHTVLAKQWYDEAEARFSTLPTHPPQSFGDMGIFFEGLSRLVLPSFSMMPIPETFQHDHDRIMKLRSDVLDAINLELCLRMYDDLERVGRYSSSAVLASQAMDDERTKTASPALSTDGSLHAPASGSRPSSLVFSSSGSATSSPRSSLVLPAYVAFDQNEAKAKARDLYISLVALLQTAPPASSQSARWQAIAPSMALQIFRFTNAPSNMLPFFEEKLTISLRDIHTSNYQEVEQSFHQRFVSELANRVREFKGLSPVSLFTAATGPRVPSGSGRAGDFSRERDPDSWYRETQEEGGIEDIATRLAHVGVLHWRVWADMAYLGDVQDSL